MPNSLPRLMYSQTEAAAIVDMGIKLFRIYVDAGQIKYKLIGNRKKFTLPDLEDFVRKQKDVPCPSTARKSRRTGNMNSKSNVIGFMARRGQTKNPSQNA